MLIAQRQDIADRACAAIEDVRSVTIQSALDISPAAAWLLTRMEATPDGVDAGDFRFDCITQNYSFFRQPELMSRLVAQLHERLGGDSTFTDNGTIRLTPLGRLRIRLALNERMI